MPARGSTTARGYGSAHQRERKRWQPVVEAGRAYCTEVVCLEGDRWIHPAAEWDLAHGDTRDTYRGPAHVLCNRSEGGQRGRAKQLGIDTTRRWAL